MKKLPICESASEYAPDYDSNKIYEKGLLYLFEVSAIETLGKNTKITVRHSIDKGVFCTINKSIEEEDIIKIKKNHKKY